MKSIRRARTSTKEVKPWELPPLPGPDFFVNPTIWRFALWCAYRDQNVLFVGPTGSGKTKLVGLLGQALGIPVYSINMGASSDPRAILVGNTHFTDSRTQFHESLFVQALQRPSLILLDELSRATLEAGNILIPVLDHQRTIALDEADPPTIISRHKHAIIMSTMNVGYEYTGIRTDLDRSIKDRHLIIELDYPPRMEEIALLKYRTGCSRLDAERLVAFAHECRSLWRRDELSTPVSTRMLIIAARAVFDGFPILEAVEYTIMTFYSASDGAFSERTKVRELLQRL